MSTVCGWIWNYSQIGHNSKCWIWLDLSILHMRLSLRVTTSSSPLYPFSTPSPLFTLWISNLHSCASLTSDIQCFIGLFSFSPFCCAHQVTDDALFQLLPLFCSIAADFGFIYFFISNWMHDARLKDKVILLTHRPDLGLFKNKIWNWFKSTSKSNVRYGW